MWLTLLLVAAVTLYLYLKHKLKYWERLGVQFRKPNIIFGNIFRVLTLKENIGQLHTDLYNEFPKAPYIGFYKMATPCILIRDADLVKNVMIRDFESFAKNDIEVDDKLDPLFGRNPFVLHGEKWKHTRSLLTPAFSSGKMKQMFPLMEVVAKNMNTYVAKEPLTECKDLCGRFTTDNVATCAFGLEVHSFSEKDGQFREMGKKIFALDAITGFKMMIGFMYPAITKLLKVRLVPDEPANYFISIVSQTLAHRAKNNIVRNDFLDMMMQLKAKYGKDFDDIDVTAHAVGFFVDGFETSATTMSFVLYCIAKNPEVQVKLRKHIETVVSKHDGNMTYEAITDMNYLEMVILESMRQYPPAMILFKKCTKDYALPSYEGTTGEVMATAGTSIIIPVYGMQNDERYFPNPTKFDPERFSDANKQNVQKCSFLPFGEGPRQCMGQRFGLLQVKVAVASIVREFKLKVNKKTIEPFTFDPLSLLTAPIGGIWIDYEKI